MKHRIIQPVTYHNHPNNWNLLYFLQKIFSHPQPELIMSEVTAFLASHPLPLSDFPRREGSYTRTILYRSDNGFEAMAARWSQGARTSIHGHPYFSLYFVMHGRLEINDYTCSSGELAITSSGFLRSNEFSTYAGNRGTFDNNIHQVHAIEETLSIHISSDDSAKGEVFS